MVILWSSFDNIIDLIQVMGAAIQNKKASFYNQQPTRQIGLHSEQLVIDVIEVILNL